MPENDRQRALGLRPWALEWSQGYELTLLASGFRQHFRRRPVHAGQWLELDERGGISFDQPLDFPA